MSTFQKTEYKTEWGIQVIKYSCDMVKFMAQKAPESEKWMIIKITPERTTVICTADDKEEANEVLEEQVRRYELEQDKNKQE